ncbi:hypothetical protein ACJX0J_014703, partial [Zea mays]
MAHVSIVSAAALDIYKIYNRYFILLIEVGVILQTKHSAKNGGVKEYMCIAMISIYDIGRLFILCLSIEFKTKNMYNKVHLGGYETV